MVDINNFKWLLACLCVCSSVDACAQTKTDAKRTESFSEKIEFSPVVVQALGNPATASYARLLSGVRAFNVNHGLAPTAKLEFVVIDKSRSKNELSIRLENNAGLTSISLSSDNTFVLPTFEDFRSEDGDLIANRRAGEVVIDPVVRSPGFAKDVRRLGDIRLWCEVVAAIGEAEMSLGTRAIASLSGGFCRSSKIQVFQLQRTAVVTRAELQSGDRKLLAAIDHRRNAFSLPLYDMSWSNDSTVTIIYSEQE